MKMDTAAAENIEATVMVTEMRADEDTTEIGTGTVAIAVVPGTTTTAAGTDTMMTAEGANDEGAMMMATAVDATTVRQGVSAVVEEEVPVVVAAGMVRTKGSPQLPKAPFPCRSASARR